MVAFRAIILLLLFFSTPELYAQDSAALTVQVHENRLTLRAQDVPLTEVLERLAQVSDIAIHIQAPLEERVNVALTEFDLTEGVQKLLQYYNTLFLYGPGTRALSGVYVLGPRESAIVKTGPVPRGSDLAGVAEPEPAYVKTAAQVEDVDQQLSALSAVETEGVSDFMKSFLHDSENAVRLTALQWLAGRRDTVVDAFTIALRDPDDVVQRAAFDMLLNRGGTAQDIEAIQRAAVREDETTLRAELQTLLFPPESSSIAFPSE